MNEEAMDRDVEALGALIRDRTADPDELATARLRAARRAAVDAMPAAPNALRQLIPFAAAAMLVVTVSVGLGNTGRDAPELLVVDPVTAPNADPMYGSSEGSGVEQLIGTEDLEFLDQLEFYAWLEMQAEAELVEQPVTDG
jgi:hypothetical protein